MQSAPRQHVGCQLLSCWQIWFHKPQRSNPVPLPCPDCCALIWTQTIQSCFLSPVLFSSFPLLVIYLLRASVLIRNELVVPIPPTLTPLAVLVSSLRAGYKCTRRFWDVDFFLFVCFAFLVFLGAFLPLIERTAGIDGKRRQKEGELHAANGTQSQTRASCGKDYCFCIMGTCSAHWAKQCPKKFLLPTMFHNGYMGHAMVHLENGK